MLLPRMWAVSADTSGDAKAETQDETRENPGDPEAAMIPDKCTIGEKYEPAMKVNTAEEATAYFHECVDHTMRQRPDIDRAKAEGIERVNIGYYSGYFDTETMARVRMLYGFGHPYISETDTPEQILEKGRQMGERMRGKQ